MSTTRKDVVLSVKSTEDPNILHIIGSTEAKDADGDIIRVKGWDLSRYKQNPVFMFGHDYQQPPIGTAVKVLKNLKDRTLEFWIKFSQDPFAQRIKALYDEKVMRMSSVGFRGIEQKRLPPEAGQEDLPEYMRGWEFTKQLLLELSAVPIGSNPEALAKAVQKGIATEDELISMGFDLTGKQAMHKDLSEQDVLIVDEQLESAETSAGLKAFEARLERIEKRLAEMQEQAGSTVSDADAKSTASPDADADLYAHILDLKQRATALRTMPVVDELHTMARQFARLTKG